MNSEWGIRTLISLLWERQVVEKRKLHWVTGILRDATGVYNHAFIINVMMSAVAIVLISFVRKK